MGGASGGKDKSRCLHHKLLNITHVSTEAAKVAAGFAKHKSLCQARQTNIRIAAEHVIAGGRIHGAGVQSSLRVAGTWETSCKHVLRESALVLSLV